MECYLENCDNKSRAFEDVGCIQYYANVVNAQIQKMIDHSLATEKMLEKEKERAGRLKQRLMAEQEKNRKLEIQLKAASKMNKSLHKSESLFDDKALKSIFKKRNEPVKLVGKENASKKPLKPPSSPLRTLTTAQKSPGKLLKQQKLLFTFKTSKEPEELEPNDSTFCETLATSGIAQVSGPSARSTPQRKPIFESSHREESEPPEVPVIKKEKLTQEERFLASDLDIFESDCEVMEEEDILPISVPDSNEITDSLVERLMEDDVEEEKEVPSPLKIRRRTKIYAECRECVEFYDSYAERNGATQADTFIRDCPKKCKGYLIRKKNAEPKECRPPMSYRRGDETPVGFWNINPFSCHDNDETPDL